MTAIPATRHAPARARSRRDARACALAALAALPSLDCAVLGLLLVERLSLIEAGQALGLPVPAVRHRYDAALARLRRALAPLLDRGAPESRPQRPAVVLRRVS